MGILELPSQSGFRSQRSDRCRNGNDVEKPWGVDRGVAVNRKLQQSIMGSWEVTE
jgi:hypothetical protein